MCSLFLLLVLVPIAEVMVMVAVHGAVAGQLGQLQAWAITIGSILLTGFAGASLARSQGLKALQGVQEALARGQFPDRALLDGACIVAGGAMLLTPGYLTDLLGLSLLIPQTRAFWRSLALAWFRRKLRRGEMRLTARGFERPGVFGGSSNGPVPGGPSRGDVVIDVTPEDRPKP